MSVFILSIGSAGAPGAFVLTTGAGTYTTLSSEYGSYSSGTEEQEIRTK